MEAIDWGVISMNCRPTESRAALIYHKHKYYVGICLKSSYQELHACLTVDTVHKDVTAKK